MKTLHTILTQIIALGLISTTTLSTAHAIEKSFFAFELGQASIDAAVASKEGITETTNYIRLAFEKQYESWIIGGGMSGFLYSDNEGFKQRVVNQVGTQSTASSSASSTNFYIEGGYLYPFSESTSVDLVAGYELITNSTRSIDRCTNCGKEDINVDAGSYITPRFAYTWGNGFKLGLFYRQYLSGDVTSTVGLNSAFGF